MLRLFTLVVVCLAIGCDGPDRELPPIPASSEIRVRLSSTEKEPIHIDDRQVVEQVISLANQYRGGWTVPLAGPPVAQTRLEFYSDGELVADLGLGGDFLTRTHGNFYSAVVGEAQVQQFRDLLGITNPYD